MDFFRFAVNEYLVPDLTNIVMMYFTPRVDFKYNENCISADTSFIFESDNLTGYRGADGAGYVMIKNTRCTKRIGKLHKPYHEPLEFGSFEQCLQAFDSFYKVCSWIHFERVERNELLIWQFRLDIHDLKVEVMKAQEAHDQMQQVMIKAIAKIRRQRKERNDLDSGGFGQKKNYCIVQ